MCHPPHAQTTAHHAGTHEILTNIQEHALRWRMKGRRRAGESKRGVYQRCDVIARAQKGPPPPTKGQDDAAQQKGPKSRSEETRTTRDIRSISTTSAHGSTEATQPCLQKISSAGRSGHETRIEPVEHNA